MYVKTKYGTMGLVTWEWFKLVFVNTLIYAFMAGKYGDLLPFTPRVIGDWTSQSMSFIHSCMLLLGKQTHYSLPRSVPNSE